MDFFWDLPKCSKFLIRFIHSIFLDPKVRWWSWCAQLVTSCRLYEYWYKTVCLFNRFHFSALCHISLERLLKRRGGEDGKRFTNRHKTECPVQCFLFFLGGLCQVPAANKQSQQACWHGLLVNWTWLVYVVVSHSKTKLKMTLPSMGKKYCFFTNSCRQPFWTVT